MPKEFSSDLKDLIKRMLEKDPKKRITIVEAMEHSWFKNAHKCPQIEDAVQDTII